jgi:hypothetical protein
MPRNSSEHDYLKKKIVDATQKIAGRKLVVGLN